MRANRREWVPLGANWSRVNRLKPGDIIADNHQVFRVLEAGEPDTRPATQGKDRVIVVIRPIEVETIQSKHSQDRHISTSPHATVFVYPDEHYPICVKCDEPLPCREQVITDELNKASEREKRYSLPGACPACQEPVTDRQLRQSWAENLIAFTGQPVTIHLRLKCIEEAQWYDALWRKHGHVSHLGYQSEATDA